MRGQNGATRPVLATELVSRKIARKRPSPRPPAAVFEVFDERIPVTERRTDAREIADTVVFLISDRPADVTGQHLFVDGGYLHLDPALTRATYNATFGTPAATIPSFSARFI